MGGKINLKISKPRSGVGYIKRQLGNGTFKMGRGFCVLLCRKTHEPHPDMCIPCRGGETILTFTSKNKTSTSMQRSHAPLQSDFFENKKKVNCLKGREINPSRFWLFVAALPPSARCTVKHLPADCSAPSRVRCHPMPRRGRAVQGQPVNLQFGFPDFC